MRASMLYVIFFRVQSVDGNARDDSGFTAVEIARHFGHASCAAVSNLPLTFHCTL